MILKRIAIVKRITIEKVDDIPIELLGDMGIESSATCLISSCEDVDYEPKKAIRFIKSYSDVTGLTGYMLVQSWNAYMERLLHLAEAVGNYDEFRSLQKEIVSLALTPLIKDPDKDYTVLDLIQIRL